MKALTSQRLSATSADCDASLKISVLFPAVITGVAFTLFPKRPLLIKANSCILTAALPLSIELQKGFGYLLKDGSTIGPILQI
jgi:hypothetical protein